MRHLEFHLIRLHPTSSPAVLEHVHGLLAPGVSVGSGGNYAGYILSGV